MDYKETRIQDWIAWMNRMLRMKEGKIQVTGGRYEGDDDCGHVDYLRMKIRIHVSEYEGERVRGLRLRERRKRITLG